MYNNYVNDFFFIKKNTRFHDNLYNEKNDKVRLDVEYNYEGHILSTYVSMKKVYMYQPPQVFFVLMKQYSV